MNNILLSLRKWTVRILLGLGIISLSACSQSSNESSDSASANKVQPETELKKADKPLNKDSVKLDKKDNDNKNIKKIDNKKEKIKIKTVKKDEQVRQNIKPTPPVYGPRPPKDKDVSRPNEPTNPKDKAKKH